MTATDRRYQLGLLALCALCALLFVVDLISGTITASEGLDFRVVPSGEPFVGRIAGVTKSSLAETAGLRNGDLVPFANLTPETRYRLISGVYSHETLQFVIERNGKVRKVSYTSGPTVPQTRWDLLLGDAANVWMFLFAALLAWRRPDSREARALSAFLSLNQIAGFAGPGDFASPWFGLDVIVAAFAYFGQGASAALLVYYASLFGRPLSPARRALTFFSYAVTAAGVAGAWRVLFGVIFGLTTPFDPYYPERLLLGASWLLALAVLFVAVSASRGKERGRLAWTTLSVAPLVVAQSLFVYAYIVLTMTYGYSVFGQLLNVCSFIAPLGMTYALLNRRLLDLGFAINRAAVFTGVSIVVVGSFMLIEFILSEFLGPRRNANVIAGAILALVLGFSMRSIHQRVDHLLDNVFFRKRHEDEHAIRSFAHQVPHITDADTIVARTCRTLEEHADASSADVYIVDRAGNYGSAKENDPAIVAMRAFNTRVDLHGLDSALNGEFAYPMMARGRLVGVVVLGQKHSHEPYAPDESDAIALLAHNAAFALDALLLRSAERNEVLEAIRESNERVLHAIDEIARNDRLMER